MQRVIVGNISRCKMGILSEILNRKTGHICENCKNLIRISDTALGCVAHDKLIMPDYLPYTANAVCKDFEPSQK